jgi:transcriptional regulator with XRE-family HTH domain
VAPRTGAERYFAEQLRDPEYRRAHKAARARIARTDALVRSLDEQRVARGMTKAELARTAGLQPEIVRRLFTMDSPNPTASTLLALADALELEVIARPKSPVRKAPPRKRAAATSKRAQPRAKTTGKQQRRVTA